MFDIRDFLLEQDPQQQEDPNQQQDPQQMQQQQAQEPEQEAGEEGSPEDQEQDMQAQADPGEQVFNELAGATIRNVNFEPGVSGGSLEILTGDNAVPYTISWTSNAVTLMKPDGKVIQLA